MFNEKDAMQLKEKGISRSKLTWQLEKFSKGVAFIQLNREATIGDGIIQFSEKDLISYSSVFEQTESLSTLKFVPASGAASRMFKDLFECLDLLRRGESNETSPFVDFFMEHIERFAFYEVLKETLHKRGLEINQLIKTKKFIPILENLLEKRGLNYGNLPKGLLYFHNYPNGPRTPFEEHLYEGAAYASTPHGPVNLHFTVSPEHKTEFIQLLEKKQKEFESRFGKNFEVSFSIQKSSTDTMAVDNENKPFRNDDGSILFRPGGHGALIDNLNELDADIIFIKNIDNVVPERLAEPTIQYKKALAGLLINTQQKVFNYLKQLEKGEITQEFALELLTFLRNKLCYEPALVPDLTNSERCRKYFVEMFDRPIRVCGVVRNQGEPGGGPFWAPNGLADTSLQIIESSQVDTSNKAQVNIFKGATHFNPVDLVCSPRRYNGNKFDLLQFIDENTCFISQKSKDGKELKSLELPGLWNGAMANWLTLFVEVPIETFNPVKTVNDLLREQHQ